MIEDLISGIYQTIITYATKFYLIIFLLLLVYLLLVFRKRIDYWLMKKDHIWRKWYKGVYLCPACHKKLKPDDYPPNYSCRKCGNSFAFGDHDVKEWIKNKPLLTRGEFYRYFTFLFILAVGALWIFSSGVLS